MLRRAQPERGLGLTAPFALSLSKGGSEGAVADAVPNRSGFDRSRAVLEHNRHFEVGVVDEVAMRQ